MKQGYVTDLTDAQWEVVRPLVQAKTGRKPTVCRRRILNAIFYLNRTGCQWRHLPNDFPHWSTVHSCFWRWKWNGALEQIHAVLHALVREQQGRKAKPSAGIVDSQSVKTTEKGGSAAALMAPSE
jgi:putative transposase